MSEGEITQFDASQPLRHGVSLPAPSPAPGLPPPAPGRPPWQATYLGYANIFCRVWAYLVDSIFITLLAVVVFSILREIAPQVLEWLDYRGQDQPLDSLWFILAAVYFVGLELTGATPGKRMLRLRVLREDGEPMTFWASLIRNALRPVDLFFLGFVGIIAYSTSEERQRVGDRAASTIVVQLPPG